MILLCGHDRLAQPLAAVGGHGRQQPDPWRVLRRMGEVAVVERGEHAGRSSALPSLLRRKQQRARDTRETHDLRNGSPRLQLYKKPAPPGGSVTARFAAQPESPDSV